MKLYYVLVQGGLPLEVFSYERDALRTAKERSVVGKPVTVVPVTPLQTEFDFEEDTIDEG
jgi:hypothetical protein